MKWIGLSVVAGSAEGVSGFAVDCECRAGCCIKVASKGSSVSEPAKLRMFIFPGAHVACSHLNPGGPDKRPPSLAQGIWWVVEWRRRCCNHGDSSHSGVLSVKAIFHQVTKLRRDHTARFYFSKVRILFSQSSLSTIPV